MNQWEGIADMHKLLLDNAVAQAEAFCVGKTQVQVAEEMASAGMAQAAIDSIAPHRTFAGGRPSTFMLGDRLDAFSIGALIAAFEHKIFLEGLFLECIQLRSVGSGAGQGFGEAVGGRFCV